MSISCATADPSPPLHRQLLSPSERQALTRRSNAFGFWALTSTWTVIVASLAIAAVWPHPLICLFVIVILGGRQLALAIITHESAHGNLFANRRANEFLGDWFAARPIWQDMLKYRAHHKKHHQHTGLPEDPDLSLNAGYPCTRVSLLRKFARDLSGLTGLKFALGLVLMDAGYLRYTVAASTEKLPQDGRRWWHYPLSFVRNAAGMLISNACLLGLCTLAGAAWVYSLWVVAWLTAFPLFVRIRSIAEHGMLPQVADMHLNTRTTQAGWLARICVAPMHVNYHMEHHYLAAVPCFRLPQLHRLLREKGLTAPSPNYWQVLKMAAQNPAAPGHSH